MDTIVVKVSDLYKQIQLMKKDCMDYVKLQILEEQPEEEIPASVFLSAYKKDGDCEIDYDEVEAVESEI